MKSIALLILTACLLSSCASTPKKVSTALTNYPAGWIVKTPTELTEGMFAYVSVWNDDSYFLKRRQEECAKRGSELEIDEDKYLVSKGNRYWLYRNKTATLVFSVKYSVKAEKNECKASILEKRHVEIRRTNSKWPYPFSKGSVRWNDPYSTSYEDMKGIKARCRSVSIAGLTGYGECTSVNKDLSNGMMLSQFRWADDMSSENNNELEIEIVIPQALIDTRIFAEYETWTKMAN